MTDLSTLKAALADAESFQPSSYWGRLLQTSPDTRNWFRALIAEVEQHRELLRDLATSGIEYDGVVPYLVVQIDRGTWDELKAWQRREGDNG